MDQEIWKEIPSLPGVKASSWGRILAPETSAKMPHGNVRVYRTKPVLGTKCRSSKSAKHVYRSWTYRGKTYKVHRLVCEAFHGVSSALFPVVLHLDENALNNRPDNLRWGTQKENLNMPKFIEYCRSRTGENSPFIKGRRSKAEVK